MTYAPPTLTALARYWVSKGGVNLGVVGDTRHQAKGTSYHLGKSQLTADAYSRRTGRDRAGLTEAASALDLGKLNGNLGQLRAFSRWFVERCRSNAPGTVDVREFIYSPDGRAVYRWDRERGVNSAPRTGEASLSHLSHSHISFYRDSERRSKTGLFSPYFTPAQPAPQPATPAKEEPVATDPVIRLADAAITRLGYFKNDYLAGDKDDALAHLAMESSFTGRILVSIVGSTVDVGDPDEALSTNPSVAVHQLLARYGHPTTLNEAGESISSDPSTVLAATPDKGRLLALLGYFGVGPARNAAADHSLRDQYYRNEGTIPLDPDLNAWADYLSKA